MNHNKIPNNGPKHQEGRRYQDQHFTQEYNGALRGPSFRDGMGSSLATYNVNGERDTFEHKVRGIADAQSYKSQRYALLTYNTLMHFIVDCETAQHAKKPLWINILQDQSAYETIGSGDISTKYLDSISRESGSDIIMDNSKDSNKSTKLELLLKAANILHQNITTISNKTRIESIIINGTDYKLLIKAIEFIQQHGKKPIPQLIHKDKEIKRVETNL